MHAASATRPDDGLRQGLEDAVALYRHMVTLRLVTARMVELQRTEKVAFHSACIGHEAVIAAAAMAARPNDWVFPGVREWGAAIVRGLPIGDYMHHAFGSGRDAAKGHSAPDHPPARRFRVAPASGVASAHVPQAVGAAWGAKIKKDDVAAIAIFEDAANRSGDLHNAMNFAGVFKPACVFVCRHDEVSADLRDSRRERAVAYGIASATVDGGDALAVLALVRAAIARGVEGKGATLIDAATAPLIVSSAPADALSVLGLGDADPLVRLRRVLEREKLVDTSGEGAFEAALVREVRATIDAAVADAERAAPPEPATIFQDVYAEVPAHLLAQKESSPWRR